jgi:hypothetical protein
VSLHDLGRIASGRKVEIQRLRLADVFLALGCSANDLQLVDFFEGLEGIAFPLGQLFDVLYRTTVGDDLLPNLFSVEALLLEQPSAKNTSARRSR